MKACRSLAAFVALGALALGAQGAQAGPNEDFQDVFADWRPDGIITACRFSREQLVNARNAASVQDFDSYQPGFRKSVGAEIARYDRGGCRGVPRADDRRRSALASVRIGKIRPAGSLRESVVIANFGPRRVSLAGATLRDRSGNRVALRGKLAPGARLRVYSGCSKGRNRPLRRRGRLFACAKKRVWNDRGDIVKLVDAGAVTVTQRGYGSHKGAVSF